MTTIDVLLEEQLEIEQFQPVSPLPTPTRCPYDARIVAHENEMRVLSAVNAFGHLRRADIARLVWPNSPALSGKKMASRTVSRQLRAGELLERMNTLGTRSLVLSRAGADRLTTYGIEAESGKDISNVNGQQFVHRTLESAYLIQRLLDGALDVYGEHAFYKNRAPLTRDRLASLYSKFPDGLVLVPGYERGYRDDTQAADWIEVEGAQKSEADYERLISVARSCGGWLDPQSKQLIVLARLVFVYVEGTNEVSILNYLRKTLLRENTRASMDALASIRMVRVKVHPGMLWLSHSEHTALELLKVPKETLENFGLSA